MRTLLCSCLLLATPLTAQPPARATAPPRESPAPAAQRDSLVKLARAQLGRRYVLGGERPEKGFDCSGLVRYVLSAFDLRAPRTAHLQALFGQPVAKDTSELQPGDILTFGYGKRISHIGIYVGNGRYIHASTAAGRVIESKLQRSGRRIKPWQGVRRVLSARSDSLRGASAAQ